MDSFETGLDLCGHDVGKDDKTLKKVSDALQCQKRCEVYEVC